MKCQSSTEALSIERSASFDFWAIYLLNTELPHLRFRRPGRSRCREIQQSKLGEWTGLMHINDGSFTQQPRPGILNGLHQVDQKVVRRLSATKRYLPTDRASGGRTPYCIRTVREEADRHPCILDTSTPSTSFLTPALLAQPVVQARVKRDNRSPCCSLSHKPFLSAKLNAATKWALWVSLAMFLSMAYRSKSQFLAALQQK